MLEAEKTIDEMWVLVRKEFPPVMKANPPRIEYIIGAKRSWLNFVGDVYSKYTLLAEHHDKGALEKMKQLALEGDRDGNE